MIKINLEVGDPVIKRLPDLGEIHGKIYSIKTITGTPFYEIKLTPTTSDLYSSIIFAWKFCPSNFCSM